MNYLFFFALTLLFDFNNFSLFSIIESQFIKLHYKKVH